MTLPIHMMSFKRTFHLNNRSTFFPKWKLNSFSLVKNKLLSNLWTNMPLKNSHSFFHYSISNHPPRSVDLRIFSIEKRKEKSLHLKIISNSTLWICWKMPIKIQMSVTLWWGVLLYSRRCSDIQWTKTRRVIAHCITFYLTNPKTW